jgi:hypothetical protein
MPGFKKSKAFEKIRVPMLVNTSSEDEKQIERVEVAHIFRIPIPTVREEWQRRMLKTKGKKVEVGSRSDANWFLWRNSILSVEGYDDLDVNDPEWKKYFEDPIGRIHVDGAVDMLMETLGSDEVEQEKKSEPSSEQ